MMRTLRARLTGLATGAVAVVLALAAVALLLVLRQQLTANLDGSLDQRADALEAALATGAADVFGTSDDADRAGQVVLTDGTVIEGTGVLGTAAPIAPSLRPGSAQAFRTLEGLPLDDDRYRVLSRPIETPAGAATLHVLENTDDVSDAVTVIALVLAGSVPVVVALLAALMWWLVGRTLAPVDRMRAEVDAIGADDIGRRIAIEDRDDEIARLGDTMNRMLERIAHSSEKQRRFVADAAHELRTPLTRIRTEVEVDRSRPATADPAATNRRVLAETRALQGLVDDLLHLARSDADESSPTHEALDLDDIVLREVVELRETVEGVTVDSRAVGAAHLLGDARALTRVVRNLLDNAARHARSTVTVSLREVDSDAELVVRDDGAGIPPEDRERVFERFARLDDARAADGGGTGLGLAIVRDVVEHHGGRVDVAAADGGGAQFVVRLPRSS